MSDDLRAAANEFGKAIGDAFKQGMRKAIAEQIADDYGPGPWVLHPDGRVETYPPPVTTLRRRRQTKTQTKETSDDPGTR